MSFTVMVTSTFEGLLFNIYREGTFYQCINAAKKDAILTDDEAELLHNARGLRNTVHAGKFDDEYPGRRIGNDLYVLYDRLIKKDWSSVKPIKIIKKSSKKN